MRVRRSVPPCRWAARRRATASRGRTSRGRRRVACAGGRRGTTSWSVLVPASASGSVVNLPGADSLVPGRPEVVDERRRSLAELVVGRSLAGAVVVHPVLVGVRAERDRRCGPGRTSAPRSTRGRTRGSRGERVEVRRPVPGCGFRKPTQSLQSSIAMNSTFGASDAGFAGRGSCRRRSVTVAGRSGDRRAVTGSSPLQHPRSGPPATRLRRRRSPEKEPPPVHGRRHYGPSSLYARWQWLAITWAWGTEVRHGLGSARC